MMGNGRMTNTWELVSIRFSLLFAFASKSQICGIAVCHGNVFFFFPNVRGCQTVAEIAMHMKEICDLIVHGLLEVAFTVVVVIESSLSWNVFFFYSNVRVQTAGEFALDMKMIFHLTVCMACQKFALTVEAKFMMAMCVCVCACVCMHAFSGPMVQCILESGEKTRCMEMELMQTKKATPGLVSSSMALALALSVRQFEETMDESELLP